MPKSDKVHAQFGAYTEGFTIPALKAQINLMPPMVPVLFSRDVLEGLVDPQKPIGSIRLTSIHGPDENGFYSPVFMVVYNE